MDEAKEFIEDLYLLLDKYKAKLAVIDMIPSPNIEFFGTDYVVQVTMPINTESEFVNKGDTIFFYLPKVMYYREEHETPIIRR